MRARVLDWPTSQLAAGGASTRALGEPPAFVDSARLFVPPGAESLRQFVRAMGAFLQGMEHYVVREKPTSPVYAYEDITELTP